MSRPLNENRFEALNLLPEISTNHKKAKIGMSFNKQLSRSKYAKMFMKKPDSVNLNYNVKYTGVE